MNMSNYNESYKKRIIIFMVITGVYLIFMGTYTITGLFVDIAWKYDAFLYAYCAYAIWFNGYSYYRYHQNSVEQEQIFTPDQEFRDFLEEMGLPQFDHKKSRRHIFLISSLAIAANVALIVVTKWGW